MTTTFADQPGTRHAFDICDDRDALLERVDAVCRLVFEQRGDYTLERYTALKGDILAVIDEQPRR
jgi:hypothetical protein